MNIDSFEFWIFDFDGTLVDTSVAWTQVDKEFFGKRGV